MMLGRESIDMVLVPSALVLMFGYHIILLYRVLGRPQTTVIGFENHNKMAWVERVLQGGATEAGLALGVISTSISASSTLSSLSIGLSSLIGAWFGSSSKLFAPELFFGDTSAATNSVKYLSLLVCFMSAFTSFVQSTRHFVHASFLISATGSDVPVSYVQTAVIRGSNFLTVGIRLLYLATTLLLWVFGPVPMFASSVAMVLTLSIFDANTTPLHQFRYPGDEKSAATTPANIVNQAIHKSSHSSVDGAVYHTTPINYE